MKKKIIPIILLIICLSMYINLLGIENKVYSQAVSASTKRYVNPIGRTVGLKLYTNGVLVVGMSEIDGQDGNKYMPYENSGIKEGDLIQEINGQEIELTESDNGFLQATIDESGTYILNYEKTLVTKIANSLSLGICILCIILLIKNRRKGYSSQPR